MSLIASHKLAAVVPPNAVTSGTYFVIDRPWRNGDTVQLDLTLPTHLMVGDHENAGKADGDLRPACPCSGYADNPDMPRLARAELAASTPNDFHLAPPQGNPETGLTFTMRGRIGGAKGAVPLTLTPYADAGGDGKSHFEVWIPLPGQSASHGSNSVFYGGKTSASRQGNVTGDIADDNSGTFSVTYDGHAAQEDWYAVTLRSPVRIGRVSYAHGRTFHDGGWFDATAGKPQIQVQTEPGGTWRTVATLDSYPQTTATDSAGMSDGQRFEARFAPVTVVGIRILGKPACGDRPEQAFSSCAELQAFSVR